MNFFRRFKRAPQKTTRPSTTTGSRHPIPQGRPYNDPAPYIADTGSSHHGGSYYGGSCDTSGSSHSGGGGSGYSDGGSSGGGDCGGGGF